MSPVVQQKCYSAYKKRTSSTAAGTFLGGRKSKFVWSFPFLSTTTRRSNAGMSKKNSGVPRLGSHAVVSHFLRVHCACAESAHGYKASTQLSIHEELVVQGWTRKINRCTCVLGVSTTSGVVNANTSSSRFSVLLRKCIG